MVDRQGSIWNWRWAVLGRVWWWKKQLLSLSSCQQNKPRCIALQHLWSPPLRAGLETGPVPRSKVRHPLRWRHTQKMECGSVGTTTLLIFSASRQDCPRLPVKPWRHKREGRKRSLSSSWPGCKGLSTLGEPFCCAAETRQVEVKVKFPGLGRAPGQSLGFCSARFSIQRTILMSDHASHPRPQCTRRARPSLPFHTVYPWRGRAVLKSRCHYRQVGIFPSPQSSGKPNIYPRSTAHSPASPTSTPAPRQQEGERC